METTEVTERRGQDIRAKVGTVAEKARSTAKVAGARADLYVHQYAWTTIGIVASLAFGIGFLLGRQQSDRA